MIMCIITVFIGENGAVVFKSLCLYEIYIHLLKDPTI